MMGVRVVPASCETASADGWTTGRTTRIQNKNSKRMKKGNAMTRKQWLLSGFVTFTCLASTLASTAAVSGPIENYAPVTAQRLENPEPANWMLYRRTYDGQGYSPLDQINTSNVKDLTPVWTFATGVVEGHEAPPIVNNGVMFVAT